MWQVSAAVAAPLPPIPYQSPQLIALSSSVRTSTAPWPCAVPVLHAALPTGNALPATNSVLCVQQDPSTSPPESSTSTATTSPASTPPPPTPKRKRKKAQISEPASDNTGTASQVAAALHLCFHQHCCPAPTSPSVALLLPVMLPCMHHRQAPAVRTSVLLTLRTLRTWWMQVPAKTGRRILHPAVSLSTHCAANLHAHILGPCCAGAQKYFFDVFNVTVPPNLLNFEYESIFREKISKCGSFDASMIVFLGSGQPSELPNTSFEQAHLLLFARTHATAMHPLTRIDAIMFSNSTTQQCSSAAQGKSACEYILAQRAQRLSGMAGTAAATSALAPQPPAPPAAIQPAAAHGNVSCTPMLSALALLPAARAAHQAFCPSSPTCSATSCAIITLCADITYIYQLTVPLSQ